jgi:hypothetical protein
MPCSVCKKSGHNKKTCVNQAVLEQSHDEFVKNINEEYNNDEYKDVDEDSIQKKEKEQLECVICYESVDIGGKGTVITKCGHAYCDKCFCLMVQRDNRCGYCREELCPPLPARKVMTYTEKAAVVRELFGREHTKQIVYNDIIRQVVYSQGINVENKLMVGKFIEILKKVDFNYVMTVVGLNSIEYYEYILNNEHVLNNHVLNNRRLSNRRSSRV